MLPTTTHLSPEDRTKLSLLFRTRGDAVSFAALREQDPLETLLWLTQPHIQPWHALIQATHREHEQTETRLALARALKDITRILDLEADSKLRIRAVNAIIRLANAIHRAGRATARATDFASETSHSPQPSAAKSVRTPRRVAELERAQDNAETINYILTTHLNRRANRAADLEDAKAPIGTPRIPDPPSIPVSSTPMARMSPMPPIGPTGPIRPYSNGQLTARAATPRPPPDRRRKRRRR